MTVVREDASSLDSGVDIAQDDGAIWQASIGTGALRSDHAAGNHPGQQPALHEAGQMHEQRSGHNRPLRAVAARFATLWLCGRSVLGRWDGSERRWASP